ncbi:Pectinesterase 1 [Dichanthelium oligosanthes]|uniref:Pectinesterase n=1 Tax=Dichanthelium oligosanthes TaxID=888268 RepID=A0A1E5US85_9POAL|nr:Pectinesterase 1 [Dichanthelium oligosanthes]
MPLLPKRPGPLLVLLVVAFAAATAAASSDAAGTVPFYPSAEAAAAAYCDGTLYPELCLSTLADIPDLHKKPLPDVICAAVNRTEGVVTATATNCTYYLQERSLSARDSLAISDCLELLSTTMDELQATTSDLTSPAASGGSGNGGDSAGASLGARRVTLDHVMTVLSAAMTNQYTCLDGFAYQNGGRVRPYIEPALHHVARMVSNSLAMAKKLPGAPPTAGQAETETTETTAPRQPFMGYGQMVKGFPRWVRPGDRRLLQAPASGIAVDAVVAKDGSGNYTTVSAAVAAAPTNSKTRYVIYIKAGAYMENVEVGKKHVNLMFVGDGIGKTVIKASRNVVDGSTTFRSATVAVVGNNFLGRDLTIENSAGPSKHQAVALRVGADLSAFYRCSFVGYQDTLYVHSLRQFFRDCDIYGTVDFVFGNAAVVLQGCNLYARKPLPNQSNIFTAQGREDPNQNTGISVQRCKVAAASDLAGQENGTRTYLGRPWKQYSRTVFLQSELDSLIDPAGWLAWDGNFALDTLYYGEYMNTGAGAGTSGRVKWKGYRVITSATEASAFTVGSFINGDVWLAGTSIPFTTGL